MKKLIMFLMFVFIFLINLTPALSIDVTSCKSNGINWLCEQGKVCTCEISGTCSNGNLLVYEDDISNPLCSPQISDGVASIKWENCNTTKDSVKTRADCNEGQSPEERIIISAAITTTTVLGTTTVPETTIPPTTTLPGMCGDGYCEYEDYECLEGYEHCDEYDDECELNEKCCCPVAEITTTTVPSKPSRSRYWFIGLFVILFIGGFIYFFFIKKRGEAKIAFKKLYEKWSRIQK